MINLIDILNEIIEFGVKIKKNHKIYKRVRRDDVISN